MAAGGTKNRYQASEALKEKFDNELDDIEQRIARLRVMYDQYFMGIEKLEPQTKRNESAKILRRTEIHKRGSTRHKFRLRSLQQRFSSYCSYWDRIVRLIEEGRIRRGVAVPVGDGGRTLPSGGDQRFASTESLVSKRRRFRVKESEDGEARDPNRKLPPVRTFGGVEVDLGKSEFAAAETDLIYRRLVKEKERAGENTDKLTRAVVEKSVSRIASQVKGKEVAFRIITKDGKVNLTAVLKKK